MNLRATSQMRTLPRLKATALPRGRGPKSTTWPHQQGQPPEMIGARPICLDDKGLRHQENMVYRQGRTAPPTSQVANNHSERAKLISTRLFQLEPWSIGLLVRSSAWAPGILAPRSRAIQAPSKLREKGPMSQCPQAARRLDSSRLRRVSPAGRGGGRDGATGGEAAREESGQGGRSGSDARITPREGRQQGGRRDRAGGRTARIRDGSPGKGDCRENVDCTSRVGGNSLTGGPWLLDGDGKCPHAGIIPAIRFFDPSTHNLPKLAAAPGVVAGGLESPIRGSRT